MTGRKSKESTVVYRIDVTEKAKAIYPRKYSQKAWKRIEQFA